jgi:hypothetical protein
MLTSVRASSLVKTVNDGASDANTRITSSSQE